MPTYALEPPSERCHRQVAGDRGAVDGPPGRDDSDVEEPVTRVATNS
jgi:hypothetical protein